MPLLDEIEAAIPGLRAYARALLRDRDAADDLVQDTLETAVARAGQWRGEGSLRGWLCRILLNRFRDGLRRRPAPVLALVPEPAAPPQGEARLMLAEVHAAMGRLPEDQRAALLLVALQGMSLAEAAQALGCAEGTLASRLARARAALRQMTGRDEGPRPRKGNT
ncbi:sigma-70 family RNA polymerase sigma factor [Neotabrizicola sp. sgz301269]|uniref:sigma-70 family RNA polymerase sigma factor n=1 Tax=Neotabrizicola sp. sgz301269 TaxID=3276282 RepID=UPI0037700239